MGNLVMSASRPTALIVDEQPFVALVAADVLSEVGFETYHASDSPDASKMLADHPEIEVVVIDAALPGAVDGLELCRRIADERPHIRIILTAAGVDIDLDQGSVPRNAQVLRKPYASRELRRLVAPASDLQLA